MLIVRARAAVVVCCRSSVADMKNSVADRSNAQVSCAGQFIANHIEQFVAGPAAGGGRWLHIDMASPAHQGERYVYVRMTRVGLWCWLS